MRTLQEQIGVRIRELREHKSVSQEALAATCGLHRTYIGLIERGERNLSLAVIEQIAAGLGVAVGELFSQAEISGAAISRAAKKKAPAPMTDVAAHLSTIRQILINAKITDAERYEAAYRANSKKRS
jgi:transcriptional regulator with XRE-family HTH domain